MQCEQNWVFGELIGGDRDRFDGEIIMEREGERNSKIAVGGLRVFCDLFVLLSLVA